MVASRNREEDVYPAVAMGLLEIDQLGRVWRVAELRGNRWGPKKTRRTCQRRKAEHETGSGYLQVRIMLNGVRYHALAHRLVYLHLHGKIPANLTVNHENGIRSDNRPENLTLMTYSEQGIHANRVLGTAAGSNQHGMRNHQAKLTEHQVLEIKRRRNEGEKLKSIAADFGIAPQTVSRIARGDRRSRG